MVFSFSVTTFEMSEATEVVTTGASASTSRGKRTATTDTGTAKLQRFQMLTIKYQGGSGSQEGPRGARAPLSFQNNEKSRVLNKGTIKVGNRCYL